MLRRLLLCLALSSCTLTPSEPPSDLGPVWVSNRVTWGQQCVPGSADERPDVRSEATSGLADAGVSILAMEIQAGATCRACYTCPAGAEVVYVRVPYADVDRARQAGFERSEQPAR